MALVLYNPFNRLQKMQHDMDKFWQKNWGLADVFTDAAAVDMYEEDGKLVAELNLPHFKKEDIKITTENDVLEISAEHSEKEERKTKRRYFLQESSNQFFRRVPLPEGADGAKAEANMTNGVLKIIMPITPKESLKEITVK